MNLQPHPSFRRQSVRFFLRAFLACVVLFAGGLYLLLNSYETLGWTLTVGFGIAVVGTLGYSFYSLYNVKCPKCGGKTRTAKNISQNTYVVRCTSCDTTWDLEVGIQDQ